MGKDRKRQASRTGAKYVPKEAPRPWERQAGEPEGAWGAFCVYRDDGPSIRSLAQVARKFGRTKDDYERMSKRDHWVERVQAWDAEVDRARREAHLAEVVDMRKRHVQLAMSLQGLGALALNKLIATERAPSCECEAQPCKKHPSEARLKPNELAALVDLGLKVERLNRGEPEAIQETRVAPANDHATGEPLGELVVHFVEPGGKVP